MENRELNLKRWKKLRVAILKRDNYLDQIALRYGRRVEATIVHHIFPREHFPQYSYCEWNLISLSNKSHNELHDRESHKLTEQGWRLLKRTAAERNIYLSEGLRKILTK